MKLHDKNYQTYIFLLINYLHIVILIIMPSSPSYSSIAIEDQEILNKLSELNKPPLKSIKISNGDIIDCIHILQQASLDHPLLKNHEVQRVPSIFPTKNLNDNGGRVWKQKWTEEYDNLECPDDTIPVKRVTFEDLKSQKYQHKHHHSTPFRSNDVPHRRLLQTSVTDGHEYATLQLQSGEYHGARATFNIWSPTVGYDGEFSLAQLWMSDGSYADYSLNTIEVGWQIWYGNSNPTLFVYWTADAYNQTGCYNLLCPGFIQTNNTLVLGDPFLKGSTVGGTQIAMTILVFRDPSTGNWWLYVDGEAVGYWPPSIFTKFQTFTPEIEWGGEIVNKKVGNQHTTTGMGSGNFAEEGWQYAAYIRSLEIVNGTLYYESASKYIPASNSGEYVTDKNCYDINVTADDSSSWGSHFYFGGPGRSSICP